jgi:hypothetical protein
MTVTRTIGGVSMPLIVLTLCMAWQVAADAEIGETPSAGEPTLQQTLEAKLKARRPVEFQFIAKVVDKVERGELPLAMVISTMVWSRRQHSRPFPYFERGIRERASRIGVSI